MEFEIGWSGSIIPPWHPSQKMRCILEYRVRGVGNKPISRFYFFFDRAGCEFVLFLVGSFFFLDLGCCRGVGFLDEPRSVPPLDSPPAWPCFSFADGLEEWVLRAFADFVFDAALAAPRGSFFAFLSLTGLPLLLLLLACSCPFFFFLMLPTRSSID